MRYIINGTKPNFVNTRIYQIKEVINNVLKNATRKISARALVKFRLRNM